MIEELVVLKIMKIYLTLLILCNLFINNHVQKQIDQISNFITNTYSYAQWHRHNFFWRDLYSTEFFLLFLVTCI